MDEHDFSYMNGNKYVWEDGHYAIYPIEARNDVRAVFYADSMTQFRIKSTALKRYMVLEDELGQKGL